MSEQNNGKNNTMDEHSQSQITKQWSNHPLGLLPGNVLSKAPRSYVCIHFTLCLKGLFHPACLERVVPWFAFVVAIFMGHENGDKQRPAKRRHVQGMLDETDPLTLKTICLICHYFLSKPRRTTLHLF